MKFTSLALASTLALLSSPASGQLEARGGKYGRLLESSLSLAYAQTSASAKSGKAGGAKSGKAGKSGKSGGEGELLDAVVVGSGLAGLIAAREMESAGLDVQVLEAQDHVGGRMVRKVLSPGQAIDFGGQWIGMTHHLMRNLTYELGLSTFPAPRLDKFDVVFEGEVIPFEDLVQTSAFTVELRACQAAFQEVVDMIPKGFYPFEPPIFNNLTLYELDHVTVLEFINNIPEVETDLGMFLCITAGLGGSRIVGHWPGEPEAVSMLSLAFSYRNGPHWIELAEYELIHGAAGQIPPILADELERKVLLSDPVIEIDQKMVSGEIQATVRTLGGRQFRAKNVVVAMSPYISGRIQYSPPLGWQRHQLNQHKPMGTVAKVMIEYDSKLWEGSGAAFTSNQFGDFTEGLLTLCIDSTDPDSDNFLYVCLITWKQYDEFRDLGTGEERVDAILQELARRLGEAALDPISVDIGDWPEAPHIQGSYSSYWPPSAWTRFGAAITRPEGVIQWCSSEVALEWAGYFEGAIEAGKRAARNVIEGNIGELREEEPYLT